MADKNSYKYVIDGVCYTQTPIVLGQAIQLSKNVNSMIDEINSDTLADFIDSLGDTLPTLMAIVLNPEGVAKQDKNIEELALILAANTTLEVSEKVVSDFFICNPTTLLLERIEKLTGVVGAITSKLMLKYFSTMYASDLQEAISQKENLSCGDLPLPK